MKTTSSTPLLLLAVMFMVAPESAKSQTLHVLEARSTDGNPAGEKTTFQYFSSKENFVHMLVKFPRAYGHRTIAFFAYKVGEPAVRSHVDINPSATWHSHEMYIPQWGEYNLTVVDEKGKQLVERKITVVRSDAPSAQPATQPAAAAPSAPAAASPVPAAPGQAGAAAPARDNAGDTVNKLRGLFGR